MDRVRAGTALTAIAFRTYTGEPPDRDGLGLDLNSWLAYADAREAGASPGWPRRSSASS
jgi:hypothetical protein